MVRLHRMKPKLVHVVEIVPPRSTGRPSRIWALGDKPDATQKSKTRRVPLVEQEARNRAQKLAEIVPRRHPDIVAFFGPAGGSHVA
ncbi:hypothetical protein [Caballeronia temeraria]|nr:hypothetical protein [Caballeronia temeraria]